jgi:hypothetical protein
MQIHSVGLDLGKTTFHLVALGAAGKVLERKFSQRQLLTYTAKMQTSLIGLEACSRAPSWACIAEQGHHVRLITAQFEKPVCEVQQERLCRSRSDRKSRRAQADIVENAEADLTPQRWWNSRSKCSA